MPDSALRRYHEAYRALHVPDYVISDKQRNHVVSDSIMFHTRRDGSYGRQVFSLEPIRKLEADLIEEFKTWGLSKGLTIPAWSID